jgi:SAM-dependent methyltransferase
MSHTQPLDRSPQSAQARQCPVCASTLLTRVLEIEQVPVLCNVLWPSRDEAISAPRGDIHLEFCENCGHLYNAAFDPALLEYTQVYENSLHFSPRFQTYASDLAHRLVETYDLRDKDIIEIGSGKGDFLRLLSRLGGNRGVGFDPSYEPDQDPGGAEPVRFVEDLYSPRYAGYKADFICCRHVLEHIEFPRDFIASVRESIGERQTVVYFEVPNVAYTLRDLGIWDLIYEHFSYFSLYSLGRLFADAGFDVLALNEAYGGQFLGIEAAPHNDTHASRDGWTDPAVLQSYVAAFGQRYRDKVDKWQRELERLHQAGKRIVIWGGGSKGVTFLNVLKTGSTVSAVVDINPRKQGRYVAGTGQQIIAPDALRNSPPDVILVMNPLYQDEIRQMTTDLGLKPELMLV